LYDFAAALPFPLSQPNLASLSAHLPPFLASFLPKPPQVDLGESAMIAYKTIHQTDKTTESIGAMSRDWVNMNQKDGWRLNFLDDTDAWSWVDKHFPETDIQWAWGYMHRGVLRADFLRYMLPLVEGGVYSDVDVSRLNGSS
jgi:alpha 1,6-mannosyltransferase